MKRMLVDGPLWRVMQFGAAISMPRSSDTFDQRLRSLVDNDAQWLLLARMPAFDRAHHLRVHDNLVQAGYVDHDLLLAGLLHDIGKVDEHGRVLLFHRVAKVLLAGVAPSLLARMAGWDNWFGHGLYLACNHAALGSILASQAGASVRCCELIAKHHASTAECIDPHLMALVHADEGSLA